MEPSGARTRSSGSRKFSARTMICGLRFKGASVAVGTRVKVGGGRGVNVSVTGTMVGVRLSGVGEAGSSAGVGIVHAEEIMRHVISKRLVRVEAIWEWYHTCLSQNKKGIMSLQNQERHDPYAALRNRDFRLLLTGRFITSFDSEMLSFAIGWELWLRTHQAFVLGMVGLVQVIPVILLSLPAGHVADQYNRKRIVLTTELVIAFCVAGLGWLSFTKGSLTWIYIFLLIIGIARAFNDPASSTLLPETIPPEMFSSAAPWN